jgi:hypothetical protein
MNQGDASLLFIAGDLATPPGVVHEVAVIGGGPDSERKEENF